MITQIIKQLQSDEWNNVSEEVEIAKGRFKLQSNFNGFKKHLKRVAKWNKIYK